MKPILWFACAVASCTAAISLAQTTIDHNKVAYFVPDKRITINAGVTDPKGVKLARTYFKAGAQADYTFVPMQAAGPNRYVATLPAPSASTPSIEYIVLAQNSEGAVSRTAAYTVEARKSNETPAWQSAKGGELKVYTEAATAPANVAGFTDSVAMDIVESGARLGAAAGVYGGATGGGAAGGTAAASTAGGLSTMAIVGGVAIAGVAAAAASSGGGGGGGGGSTGTTGGALAGSWSGTVTNTGSATCTAPGVPSATATCTSTQPFTGTLDAQGNFNYNLAATTQSCTSPGAPNNNNPIPASTAAFTVSSAGAATIPGQSQTTSGITVSCPTSTITFASSPRRISGSYNCTTNGTVSGTSTTCTGTSTTTWSGQ